MNMKKKQGRKVWKQVMSWLLCICMMAPSMAPIVAEAATGIGSLSRQTAFTRPRALTLQELGIRRATGSDIINIPNDLILDEDEWMEELARLEEEGLLASWSNLATDADMREPENFYDYDAMIDEPDGELIQFNDYFRTYETGDHEYVTMLGGYSGLYQDEDGTILSIDNTLEGRGVSRRSRMAVNPFDYYQNTAGGWNITIPSKITSDDGIRMEKEEDKIELIPQEGDFSRSIAAENAIRFTNVFDQVDYQYTVLGSTVKEDIILMKPTNRSEFIYKLKIPGMKAAKQGGAIVIYKTQRSEPVFQLEAPVMMDADGDVSTGLELSLSGNDGTYTVRVKADEEWLADSRRSYPVRIDPANYVPSNEFILARAAQGQPGKRFGWDEDAYVGYVDATLKNCQTFIAFNESNCPSMLSFFEDSNAVATEALLQLTTQTNNSDGNTVFQLCYPIPANGWNAHSLSWNTKPPVEETDIFASAPGVGQDVEFNITARLNEWIKGTKTQAGFALKAQIEAADGYAVMPAELFYNRSSEAQGPRIRVTWEGEAAQTDMAEYALADTTALVKPSVIATDIKGRTVTGVLAHGKTTAEAEVEYRLMKMSGEADAAKTDTAHGSLDRPDFEDAGLDHDQNAIKQSNWQSVGYPADGGLEFDTIYHFSVSATAPPEEEEEGGGDDSGDSDPETFGPIDTDTFLLYEVQANDLVQRIAKHYGVNPNTIASDNCLYLNQLTEAETILFIRNPKTDRPYTPKPMSELEELLLKGLLSGMNPECFIGLEPVSINTGNFYMNQTDVELEELNGAFGVSRSYNSIIPDRRSEFGTGWSSPMGEHLTVLGDGRILYKREDGAYITLKKDGEFYKGENGRDLVLEPMSSLDVETNPHTKDEAEEENNALTASSSNAAGASASSYGSNAVAAGNTDDADDTNDTEDPEDTDESEDGEEEPVPALPGVAGWKLTSLDGTSRVFDSLGFLQYREDRKGHRTTMVYDEDYALIQVISPTDKTLDITMDEDFCITEIGLPDGTSLSYEYDDEGNLTAFTNQEGDSCSYQYDDAHHMTSWTDENGSRVVENVYDEEGRVTEQTDANGSTASISYSGDHSTMTDNNGHVTTVYFDEMGRTIRVEDGVGTQLKKSYDEDGRLKSQTDANGAVTHYTYDENGNVQTETRDDGSSAHFTYDGQNLLLRTTDYEGNVTSFTYDEAGNLRSMTDGAGNTSQYEYDGENRMVSLTDPNGGITTLSYDGAAVVSLTDPEGGVTAFTYDEMNRVLSETDPEGNTTEHAYNANGWETLVTAPDGGAITYEFSSAGEVLSITDAMGSETVFTYDKMHNILSGEDALGNTLSYTYDGNYNKVSETNAKGSTTAYVYDARDRVIEMTDALDHTIHYTLDGRGSITGTTDRRGNTGEAGYHKVLGVPTVIRDETGNETLCSYDANGNLTRIAYPDGSRVSYVYDGAGRVTETTAQNGLVTRQSYDGNGNIVRITDGDTRVYRFEYDGNNRLVKAVDPLGGVSVYTYDKAGKQISAANPNNAVTGYTYDAAGRLLEAENALQGVVATQYDLNGRMLQVTDQNGHSTVWNYDAVGQVTAQVDAADGVTAMEYDSLGNVTKTIDALRGETTAELDALSRTTKVTDAMGGEYTCEYDENGNLLKITMPDGDTQTMTYDAGNRVTTSTDEAGVVTTCEYDSMGRVTKAQDTAGNIMTYEYDTGGNLVKQTDTIGREAVYEYDQFNRLVSVTGTDLATTAYAYDALDRLIGVTQADGTVTTYEYDPVGNLIKTTQPGEAVYTYAYDAINRLTGKVNPLGAATTFQYDAKGNLLEATDANGVRNSYVYDALDRLTAMTDGNNGVTNYEYDELSRLLSQTTPEGSKAEYRYDALSRMTKEKDPNGLITEHQYDVMGNRIKTISPKGAQTSYTYDKHDELTGITDPMGNVTGYEVDKNRQVTKMTQKNGGEYQYTYDAVHRLTGITTPLGHVREFTYDVADNIVTESDNLGRTNTYEYDIMHRMTKAVNAKGGVTAYGYDIRGNQNALTDAMGYTWNSQYDLIDQLTKSVDPEGKATEAVYDLVGNITSVTTPGERTTSYAYDHNYNQTALTDPKGYVYQISYDKDDRAVGTIDPLDQTQKITYDPGSRVTAIQDKMGLTREFGYDAHGNILTSRATDGLITNFQYDILDRITKVTDPMGYQTLYDYDVMGNITAMTNAQKNVTTYTYDLESNLTSLTSPMGRTEEYTYDVAGRISSRHTAEGSIIHYDYDKLNGLADKTYEDVFGGEAEHPVQMGYNVMGQRISMEDITGDSSYTYDSLGRLKTSTNGSGKVVEYYYDEANNLQEILYPDGYAVVYEYDKNDNITKITDRDGRETTYEYDPLNRLTGITRADGSTSTYTYNARDQILEAENLCACGFLISNYKYTYNDAGLITAETAKECLFTSNKDYGHKGGSKDDCAHTSANPWQNQNPVWETTKRTFTYDNDGQMTECREDKGQFDKTTYTYTYDEAGNRTLAKKQELYKNPDKSTYTYNADNQMVSAIVCEGNLTKRYTYTYDANGNLTQECLRNVAETTYQYDTENRLAAVYDKQKLLMAAAYDGDGNRTFQLNYNPDAVCGYGKNMSGEVFMPENSTDEDGNETAEGYLFGKVCSKTGRSYDLTEYVNDTNREYTQVLSADVVNSGATESYSYAGNQRLSRNNIWNEARGVDHNETSYYLYDGRGSVTANTWYNGMVTNAYQYDPYGEVTLGSTDHEDFYGYNAESYNPNTGLEYLRARYYNADMGRFFQEDTYLGDITDPLTLNRYAYVKNSPMNYVDPSGHKAKKTKAEKIAESYNQAISYIQKSIFGDQDTLSVDFGKNTLQIKIEDAEAGSEAEQCGIAKRALSAVLGFGSEYNTLISTSLTDYLTKKTLNKMGLGNVEDYLAERYLDAESYYTGRALCDYLVLLQTKPAASVVNAISKYWTDMYEKQPMLWNTAGMLGIMSALMAGEATGGGEALIAGAAGAAGTAAGVGAATAVGGVTIVIGVGAAGLISASVTNKISGERLEENSEKKEEAKGDRDADLPEQAGRGQSKGGKHEPTNLDEKLAMEEAMSNPENGMNLEGKNTDPRWPAKEGWEKWTQNVNGHEIHYEYNPLTGEIDDVKIK